MRMVGAGGIAILPAAPVRTRSRDVEYRYRQDSDFYYLTGFAEPEALQLMAEAYLALDRPAEARRAAAEAATLMTERATYGFGISCYGTLARVQLAQREAPSEVEGTLNEYAAAIEHTGMRLYEREVAELRALLQAG